MSSNKIMAFGKELMVTPDTLGVHTEESEDKLLDIPLTADKLGKYTPEDIDTISENLTKYNILNLVPKYSGEVTPANISNAVSVEAFSFTPTEDTIVYVEGFTHNGYSSTQGCTQLDVAGLSESISNYQGGLGGATASVTRIFLAKAGTTYKISTLFACTDWSSKYTYSVKYNSNVEWTSLV